MHVPVPRRGRRGAPRAADRRAARPAAAAPAARHRPVVRRAGAARGLAGRLPARGPPRRARRAHQRPAQPARSPTARSAARRSCFAHGYATPGLDRARPRGPPGRADRDWWCRSRALRRDCPGHAVPAGPLPAHRARTRCWSCTTAATSCSTRRRRPCWTTSSTASTSPRWWSRSCTRATGSSSTPNSAAHARFLTARAAAAAGGRAAAGRPAGRAVPARAPASARSPRCRAAYRAPGHLRRARADVRLVRLHRHRRRPRRRAGVRPGGEVRQPLPGPAAAGSPTGCSSAAGSSSR